MRTVLSILLAVLAGLLAALSLVGARAEALVHTPEPLQQIAAPMSQDPELREAVPGEVSALVEDQLPEGMPGFVQSAAAGIVEGAASGLVEDERFPSAWSAVLEETRLDWVARMDRIAAEGTTSPAGTVHLQTAPLLELSLDRLAEAMSGVPGGEAVTETLREGVGEGLGEGLSVDLSVPDPDAVPMEAVALTVDNLYRWPWIAGTSAIVALLALLVAPRRRKGVALAVAGVTVLVTGVAARWGLEQMALAEDTGGMAGAAADSLMEGIRDYALPDTALLMAGGAVIAAVGLIVVLLSGRSVRPGSGRV